LGEHIAPSDGFTERAIRGVWVEAENGRKVEKRATRTVGGGTPYVGGVHKGGTKQAKGFEKRV